MLDCTYESIIQCACLCDLVAEIFWFSSGADTVANPIIPENVQEKEIFVKKKAFLGKGFNSIYSRLPQNGNGQS